MIQQVMSISKAEMREDKVQEIVGGQGNIETTDLTLQMSSRIVKAGVVVGLISMVVMVLYMVRCHTSMLAACAEFEVLCVSYVAAP